MENERIFEEIVESSSSSLSLHQAHVLRSAYITALIRWDKDNPNFTPELMEEYAAALYSALLILKPPGEAMHMYEESDGRERKSTYSQYPESSY